MDLADLNIQAIKVALEGKWQTAVRLNKEVLKEDSNNIEALSRLAKAYLELKNNKIAAKFYRRVLKLDRFNPIAKRALKRLKDASLKTSQNQSIKKQVKTNFFLEEPGKTKTVTLIRTGDLWVLSELDATDFVLLKPKKHSISVYDQKNRYLGKIPDDLSLRLIKLINRGNKYAVVVKSLNNKSLQIFIREVKQSKKNTNILSFPDKSGGYHPFLSSKVFLEEPLDMGEEE